MDHYVPLSKLANLLYQAHTTIYPLQVVELGSGTGIGGLALARMLPKDSEVLLTDLPDAMTLLVESRNANAFQGIGSEVDVRVMQLDWHEPLPESVIGTGKRWDVLLVTDCTYNDSVPALVVVLEKLAEAGRMENENYEARRGNEEMTGSGKALVVVAMKVRHADEAVFFELMKGRGFVQVEHEVIQLPDQQRATTGLEPEQIEIYSFQLA